MSAYFLSVNRNKRSLSLNLKHPDGQALARQLAAQADILIENFKLGQMATYSLDYPTLHDINPRLIYCSITGYGQDGPYAHRPGYDYAVQGQSGLMAITGPPDGQPYKVGVAITDVIAGLFAANAIQSALLYRHQSDQGQYIDMSLLDTTIAALVNVNSNYLVSGQSPQRYGNAHPNIVPYQAFQAADATFIIAAGNDSQFGSLCRLINHPEWAADDRFATNPARVQNREALIKLLQPILKTRTVSDWVDSLLSVGVPAAPINDIPDVFADPHVQSRNIVQQVLLANGVNIDLVTAPAKLSETPPTIRYAPPMLGQHTDTVLHDWLNLDAETIQIYRQNKII
jgi:formyl-CoA transferase